MNDLIDQEIEIRARRKNRHKGLNSVAFGLIGFILIYTFLKIWQTNLAMDSPLLPEYTTAYLNASLLNISTFMLIATIPAIFLRRRKNYSISTYCILLFALLAFFFKDSVRFYEWFYGVL